MRQFLVVALLAAPAAAAPSSMTPAMDKLLMEGVDAIYRMDFAAADRAAEKAIALDPEYPHAYLGQAATDLIRFSYGTEQGDESLVRSFEAKTAKAASVAEAYLKKHPKDTQALLVLGSAHGIAGRMATERHQWLAAFKHGRAAMRSIRLALKEDPELADAQLGLGMFDYYVDTIPRFAGWLAKIMLGGDRARGIREIRIAAEKGRFTKTAAQLILVEIDTEDQFGARNPPEAVTLMRGIRAEYPDSAMLHGAQIAALYEDKRYDEAIRETSDYKARAESGRYPALHVGKAHSFMGTLFWATGDMARALEEYRAGARTSGQASSRWTVWNLARMGQVLDALGRRAEALEAYRAALAQPDRWDFASVIKPCLSKPCVGAKYPGQIAPD